MTTAQRGRRNRALAAALLLSVAGMLPVTLTGALAVQIRQTLAISGTWLGVLVAAYFLGGALLASRVGVVADRVGWRRASAVAALTSGGALLAMALVVRDPWVAVVVLGVGGVAMSASVSISNLVLAREMPGERLGLLLGLKQSAIPLAGLASGLAIPLVGLTLGWRWAFSLAVVVPLAAVGAAWSVPSGPAEHPDEPSRSEPPTTVLPTRGPSSSTVPLVVTPRLRVVALGSGFASVVPGVLTGFTVVTAVDVGLGEAAAGALLAAGSVLGIVIRVSTGWRMDRTDRDGLGGVALLLVVGALGAGLLASGRLELLVPGVLLAFAGGWGWPAMFFYEVVRDHPVAPGAATGVVQGPGMLGTAVGPIAFGWIADTVGVETAWAAAAAATAVAAIVIAVASRLGRPDGSLARSGASEPVAPGHGR